MRGVVCGSRFTPTIALSDRKKLDYKYTDKEGNRKEEKKRPQKKNEELQGNDTQIDVTTALVYNQDHVQVAQLALAVSLGLGCRDY